MTIPQTAHAVGGWTRHVPVVTLFVLELTVLTGLSRLEVLPVPALIIGFGTAFATYLMLSRYLTDRGYAAWPVFLMALALRVPWFVATPSLSDDVWRYLHDGRAQLVGENPYRHPPSAPETQPYRGPEFSRINHPDMRTIYPPAAQLSFRIAAQLGATVLIWKAVLLVIEVALMVAILVVVRSRGYGASALAWYALHPLPVIEFAGNGHVDALGIAGLVTALALVRTPIGHAIGWAVSVAAKYLALPIILFAFRGRTGRYRASLTVAALGSLALLYLPFVDAPSVGSLGTFADTFEFNGPVYLALRGTVPHHLVRILLASMAATVLVSLWWQRADVERAAFWWVGSVLLLSPIVHPWYVTWLIPFVCWRRAPWVLAWSWSVVLAYLVLPEWRAAGTWDLPAWVMVVEYLPVYTLLAAGFIQGRVRARADG